MSMRQGSTEARSPSRGPVRGRLLGALMAATLALLAAVLVACGSSSKLIPEANAGPLKGDFEAVAADARSGEGSCAATEAAVLKTEQDFAALPSALDPGLRERLRAGITNLRNRALVECAQSSTAGTTATSTTPKTTPTNTTPTTPTNTETTTTTTTPPTSTETTPPPTSTSTPGGGTPAPKEEPGAGGQGGGTGAGGSQGNGQGNGQ